MNNYPAVLEQVYPKVKMFWHILATLVVIAATVIGYYATLPVPEGLPNPNKMRVITAALDIMFSIIPHLPESIQNKINNPSLTEQHPDVTFNKETMDGVPVIIYRPVKRGSRPLPVVVYVHGGGWLFGSINQSHHDMLSVAVTLKNVMVISVGYRLAPKHIFPAAIDDVTKATIWLLRHVDDLSIDPEKIILMGDSAGGNLVAAVSQRLTFDSEYKDLPKVKAQVLIYPCLQMFDFQTPSYQQNGNYRTLVLDSRWMATMWNMYLTGNSSLVSMFVQNEHISTSAKKSSAYAKCVSHDLIPSEFKVRGYVQPDTNIGNEKIYDDINTTILDPDFAPLMRPTLKGLPEAYIVTCEFDILRDDGILYAKRLEADDVKTTWRHYKDGYHGKFTTETAQTIPDNGLFNDNLTDDLIKYLKETIEN